MLARTRVGQVVVSEEFSAIGYQIHPSALTRGYRVVYNPIQSANLLQMENSIPISALNLMHHELHVFSCAKLDSDAKKKGVG
jgi:hypothetical protein